MTTDAPQDDPGATPKPGKPGRDGTPEWLTATEAARRLAVSRRTLNRAVDEGRLKPQTIRGAHGPELRFSTGEVDAYAGQRDAIEATDHPSALADSGTPGVSPTPGSDVAPTSGQEAGAALFAQAVDAAVARATAPLVAELEAARRERHRFQEASAAREASAQALAAELGATRERARRAQADADQARAQLQAYTQAEQEKRETEAYAQANALLAQIHARQRAEWKAQHRPWWWRFLGR